MNALELRSLKYHYLDPWSRKPKEALKGISLDVAEGESFGFLGHNGAGKTTTIKCILRLIQPTSGTVAIRGIPNTEIKSRRSVGYLPEQPYFYDHLTVQEIVEMYASLAGVNRFVRRSTVSRALESVGIGSKASSPMRSLSKGLTQRVAMAQAIVSEPTILILDEPFSGLDPIGRREFRDLLVQLKQRGTTIFMCSHILSDVEFLCDRVSIMSQGELRGIFSVKEIPQLHSSSYELVVRNSPESRNTFGNTSAHIVEQEKFLRLTFQDNESAEAALALALKEKFGIESFEHVQGNLEDLFVQLVQYKEG